MTVLDRVIKLRRDPSGMWVSNNPVLNEGELGLELDTRRFKFGDGSSTWNVLPYATAGNTGGYGVSGSLGSPALITAAGGISVAGIQREYQILAGSPGAVSVAASPMIAAGTTVGQELVLEGTSNSSTVTLPQAGTGVDLNGAMLLKAGSRIYLVWNGSKWGEVARK